MMIEKDMSNEQLQKKCGFSSSVITRLKRDGYISLETICHIMECGVDDILEFVLDEDEVK